MSPMESTISGRVFPFFVSLRIKRHHDFSELRKRLIRLSGSSGDNWYTTAQREVSDAD